jgi:epoxyqueuosine reductase
VESSGSPPTLTQTIKSEAHRLGFILAGVTTPDPPPHGPVFTAWLTAGRHGQMAYLANEQARLRRLDPRRILPECRSILVLAVPYPPAGSLPEEEGQDRQPRGRVAAYAWGDDYHEVLPQRMKALVSFIETRVGHPVPHRYYTDTGPLLERDLAQRAGLGWIGKNTCLINPRQGSYFLLAEILLGIELDPDPPFETDHCGSCTRCLDACPTNCILPDRTIDARRCTSYLTIELKEDIPPDLRPAVGDWVFGCDVCQVVCPWNRFANHPGDRAFAPRPGVPRPILAEDILLSQEEFSRKFRNSPVKRAKRRGYQRNLAVALGNAGGSQAAAALEAAANHPEPQVRSHALWALEQGKDDDQTADRHP